MSLHVALEKELVSAEKRVKRNETQSRDIIPPNFNVALVDKLGSRNSRTINGESAGGYVDQVVSAEFQADSCVMGMLLNNNAIMLMTKDTDIPILAGDCCMGINEFTKNRCQIVSTSESTLKFVMSLLQPMPVANFKPAIKPIFDGIQNPRLHALMMVILGCSVYVSRMVGVSVATLSKMIDVKKQDLDNAFTEGVVHANVGQNVTPHNPSLGLFLYHFYIQWSRDVTSQSTTTQTTNKHHHHGDGAARPSSGVDLMIPRRPSGEQPCTFIFFRLLSKGLVKFNKLM